MSRWRLLVACGCVAGLVGAIVGVLAEHLVAPWLLALAAALGVGIGAGAHHLDSRSPSGGSRPASSSPLAGGRPGGGTKARS